MSAGRLFKASLLGLPRLLRGELFQPLAAVFGRGFEVVAKFVFQIAVTRCLGGAEAGLFLLALSILSVLHTVAKLGIDRALVICVAKLDRDADRATVFAAVVAALGVMVLFAAAVGILIAVLAEPVSIYIFAKPALAAPLRWLALGIVSLAVLTGISGVLTGLGAAIIGDVFRSSVWPALGAALLVLTTNAAQAAAVTTLSIIVALVGAWLFMRHLMRAPWPRMRSLKLPAELMATAYPLCAVDTIGVILVSVPTIVLGALASAEAVAVFSVANRIANVFVTIVSAIGNAASPRFALLTDENDTAKLGRAVSHIGVLALATCLPLALALFAFPGEALALFGREYVRGATMLRVLLVGDLVFMSFACCSELLAMSGNGKLLRRINVVLLAACTVLSLTLIPLFGARGAATATAITIALNGVLVGIGVHRRLKLSAVPLLAGGLAARRR